ncbi:hypothetical protein [Mycolicibacterium arenosum]|uniref:Transmembrane protein n=1 Tax=Mycolicibacterium arenosum TaxID=2952157 RepID=A0ABT1M9Y9_9MYCO|nr:hypothetical protein [Mycolicibacterium sp. CAU 1645]MCP9275647.1 hypothetical protein [Mycolicibacterium sp. CAU 1645]
MSRVARTAVVLIALQLVLRAVLAFGGYFYWDDLILIGRAGTQTLLSPTYLFDDHDGHVMPGAFLVAGGITRLAPLNWFWPALSLVLLQLLASLALLRALHTILGWRPVLLIPLTFALFTPLGVPAFAWWAAGLNALPMIAAMAWVSADAILLVRTGDRRYAVTGTAVFLIGLLFFEKAAVIPFVAVVVTVLLAYVRGEQVRTVWQRGRPLWVATAAVTVAWIGVYLLVVDQQRWSFDLGMTWELLSRSVTHGIVPGLVGGPWEWQRWAPASPWATPSAVVMVLGWVVLGAVVAVSFIRKQRIGPVWAAAAGYAVACQVPIYLMRSSQFTALELAQTLRYLPDLVVVLTLLMAVGLCAPNRADSGRLDASRARTVAVVTAVALFAASSGYSTVTFLRSWRDNPTRNYLETAEAALAQANSVSQAPMLDQEVDPLILQRIQWPENLASHVFALLRDRPEFDAATTDLRMFDSTGRILPAKVTWVRSIVPGPDATCGYLVQPLDGQAPVRVPLDGPMLPSEWTAEINYLANSDGSLTMSMTEGAETKVPVRPGLNRVFVRLSGAGDALLVRANTSALSVCLAAGPVGYLAPA